MINLNDDKYKDKKMPESDEILKYLSDFNIFKYYYPELELSQTTNSPLREDRNPSFSVYWSKKYNKFMFKDFATGDRGDAFIFVSKLLGLNYFETLERIIIDFNLDNIFSTKKGILRPPVTPKIYDDNYIKSKIKDAVRLNVKAREWKSCDDKYWMSFGISRYILNKFRVIPISHIFLNDEIIKSDELSYVYVELKDMVERYKIYQPYSKKLKWINNLVEGTLSGWSQLPNNGDMLIIASSLKDAMCLYSCGFKNVIAPQTENYIHKQHIIDALKSRFNEIYLFYDYDTAGIMATERIIDMYGLKYIYTNNNKLKDPSDYYRANGRDELIKLINKQL